MFSGFGDHRAESWKAGPHVEHSCKAEVHMLRSSGTLSLHSQHAENGRTRQDMCKLPMVAHQQCCTGCPGHSSFLWPGIGCTT